MTPRERVTGHPAALPADETSDERLSRIRQRPDGYHWIDVEGRQEFGPFATLEEALADMDEPSEAAIEQAEMVEEAEQELEIGPDVEHRDEDEPEAVP